MSQGHDGHDHEGHDHGHSHGHSHGHFHGDVSGSLTRALIVTVIFMVIELVGGYFANSLALISDGAHMLTDVGAMLLSMFAYWVSKRPANSKMSFGYHRAEILGALASGLAIWVIAGFLVYEAVSRMADPPEVRGPIVFFIATLGLCANLLSMRMLHSAKEHSLNVRAAYLHMVADSLGSVGAIIAGAVIWISGWRPIDPIVTIVFAVLMLVSSWSLIQESISVLMESAPTHLDPDSIRKELAALPGVQEVHDLHVWMVSSGRPALSVHIVAAEHEAVLSGANAMLKEKHGIIHTTIQVEHPAKFQSERCYDCN